MGISEKHTLKGFLYGGMFVSEPESYANINPFLSNETERVQ